MRTCLNMLAFLLTRNRQAQASDIDWGGLRYQHVAALRARLADRYEPSTANKHLSALRGVLANAFELGQLSPDDYARVARIKNVRGQSLPKGRALAPDEIAALLGVCAADTTAAGRRDAAIVALLWSVGLRRAEVCELNLDDYDAVAQTLKVRGKGHKERSVPVEASIAQVLARWLAPRGSRPGVIFCPVLKGNKVVVRRMRPEAIYNMLRKRTQQAHLKRLSPHDLRRTFVSDLLDAGVDIVTVQKIAGHSNVTTTARYDRRGEAVKLKAVQMRKLPEVK